MQTNFLLIYVEDLLLKPCSVVSSFLQGTSLLFCKFLHRNLYHFPSKYLPLGLIDELYYLLHNSLQRELPERVQKGNVC